MKKIRKKNKPDSLLNRGPKITTKIVLTDDTETEIQTIQPRATQRVNLMSW